MDEMNKKGTLKSNSPETKKGHKNDDIKSLVSQYVAEAVNEIKSSMGKDFEERIAAEREDAAKLATMSSEERAKAEIEKSRKDFESERAQYVSERAEFEAAKELTAEDLPVTFARFVADGDKEKMLENISVFKAEYRKAIEAGLSERLRGSLPRVSREKEQAADPFLSGLGL